MQFYVHTCMRNVVYDVHSHLVEHHLVVASLEKDHIRSSKSASLKPVRQTADTDTSRFAEGCLQHQLFCPAPKGSEGIRRAGWKPLGSNHPVWPRGILFMDVLYRKWTYYIGRDIVYYCQWISVIFVYIYILLIMITWTINVTLEFDIYIYIYILCILYV
jgi:hypothetical protein